METVQPIPTHFTINPPPGHARQIVEAAAAAGLTPAHWILRQCGLPLPAKRGGKREGAGRPPTKSNQQGQAVFG